MSVSEVRGKQLTVDAELPDLKEIVWFELS